MRRKIPFREHPGVFARKSVACVEALAGRRIEELHVGLPALPVKRAPRIDHEDLEKHTLAAVGELLAVHPKILFAVRQNSGGMQYADAQGKTHSMWFYRIITGQPVRISDYWGILRDGRMLAMECKRPSWSKPSDKRELEQAAFLMLVRNCGGVSGFVRNADEANALLS